MSRAKDMLAVLEEAVSTLAEKTATSASSITELNDDDFTAAAGESTLDSAVLAHRIVARLRDAASQLEVMAFTLHRQAAPLEPLPSYGSPLTPGAPSPLESMRFSEAGRVPEYIKPQVFLPLDLPEKLKRSLFPELMPA